MVPLKDIVDEIGSPELYPALTQILPFLLSPKPLAEKVSAVAYALGLVVKSVRGEDTNGQKYTSDAGCSRLTITWSPEEKTLADGLGSGPRSEVKSTLPENVKMTAPPLSTAEIVTLA
jgi:hypothetical protein